MKAVVIYQSRYGFSEVYARWIAEDLNADLLTADKVKPADLQKYTTIVFGGGLYAGGVNGITLLTNNFESIKDKALYLFTVGAADVTDKENLDAIRSALARVLTPPMLAKMKMYHLRGGIKYSKMGLVHRIMMGLMIKAVRKKPTSELRAEDTMMLETYGKDIDFTDRESIAQLVADIQVAHNHV